MQGQKNVKALVHEEAGHMDLYDVNKFVDPIVKEIYALIEGI
jgi:hypothetical protein